MSHHHQTIFDFFEPAQKKTKKRFLKTSKPPQNRKRQYWKLPEEDGWHGTARAGAKESGDCSVGTIAAGQLSGQPLGDGGDARLLAGWAEEEAGPHGSASV